MGAINKRLIQSGKLPWMGTFYRAAVGLKTVENSWCLTTTPGCGVELSATGDRR